MHTPHMDSLLDPRSSGNNTVKSKEKYNYRESASAMCKKCHYAPDMVLVHAEMLGARQKRQ